VRGQEIRGIVVLIRQAIKRTIDGPEDQPPPGVLETLTVRGPYRDFDARDDVVFTPHIK
jgi:hypothetical protein